MTRHSIVFVLLATVAGVPPLAAQRLAPPLFTTAATAASARPLAGSHGTLSGIVVHYGKWLTAAGAVGLTVMAAEEHQKSQRQWKALLAICRSADAACQLAPNGAYERSDAEALFQLSRRHDRKANEWLFAAQATLFATTALFIIDLHPGQGPGNIPYPSEIRVGALGTGTGVEMRMAF
jgi:hypothetical protein